MLVRRQRWRQSDVGGRGLRRVVLEDLVPGLHALARTGHDAAMAAHKGWSPPPGLHSRYYHVAAVLIS